MNGTVPSTGPNPSSTPGLGLTPSLVALVLANLWPLVGVILLSWTVFAVLFLFWLENVVVGLFNVGRMWMANGPSEKAGASKATLIPFFMVHYGMFAAVHGLLVIALFGGDPGAMLLSPTLVTRRIADTGVWPAALALTASHGFSFVVNYLLGGEFRTTSLETATATAPVAKNIAVVLINFTNLATQPYTKATVLNALTGGSMSAKAFLEEGSKGRMAVTGDAFGWYTIPATTTGCDWTAALDAATTASPVRRAWCFAQMAAIASRTLSCA